MEGVPFIGTTCVTTRIRSGVTFLGWMQCCAVPARAAQSGRYLIVALCVLRTPG